MDKLDMLYIRACKVENPDKRLISLYKRFYCRGLSDFEMREYISTNLVRICEEYNLVSLSRFVHEMERLASWYCKETCPYVTAKNIIRFTAANKLPSAFISPSRFR